MEPRRYYGQFVGLAGTPPPGGSYRMPALAPEQPASQGASPSVVQSTRKRARRIRDRRPGSVAPSLAPSLARSCAVPLTAPDQAADEGGDDDDGADDSEDEAGGGVEHSTMVQEFEAYARKLFTDEPAGPSSVGEFWADDRLVRQGFSQMGPPGSFRHITIDECTTVDNFATLDFGGRTYAYDAVPFGGGGGGALHR